MAEQKPQKQNMDEKEEKPLNKDENVTKHTTFREKLCDMRDNITVEPLLAGLIIPSVISMFAMMNLNLDKACRVNLGYTDEICTALVKRADNHTEEEKAVQKLISSIDIWKGVIKTLIPSMLIMFLGAWSDRTGKRKLCILLPVFGEMLTSVNNLINVYFFYEIPVQGTIFMEIMFTSITGGWMTMFLGVFSYISDITPEETRTFRVGVVNFCMTVGFPIGIGASGFLLQRLGYYGIFTMTLALTSVMFLYGCFCLKEPDAYLQSKGLPSIERPQLKEKVSFFNLSHVTETVTVAFKKRPNNRRLHVLLTLFSVFILFGPSMSEHGILYLFVRNRLNWDMVKFSLYTSYSIVLHSIGAIFSITVLSKKFQVDDSLLCLISVTSKFVGGTWTAFVKTDLEMYLVPVVEFLNATTFTSLRSIISKLVEKQDTAKVNSLFSLTETLASLLFHPFYSWLYMSTLHVMSGAVFLVSAALIIPASVILITFYVQHRRELSEARKTALEEEEKKEAAVIKKNDVLNPYYVPDNKNILIVDELKHRLSIDGNIDKIGSTEKCDEEANEKNDNRSLIVKTNKNNEKTGAVNELCEKEESHEREEKGTHDNQEKETKG